MMSNEAILGCKPIPFFKAKFADFTEPIRFCLFASIRARFLFPESHFRFVAFSFNCLSLFNFFLCSIDSFFYELKARSSIGNTVVGSEPSKGAQPESRAPVPRVLDETTAHLNQDKIGEKNYQIYRGRLQHLC